MLAITSGRDYAAVQGRDRGDRRRAESGRCVGGRRRRPRRCWIPTPSCRLRLGGQVLGYVGQLRPEGARGSSISAARPRWPKCRLARLVEAANLVPRYVPQSPYPAVTRDLNLVVDEAVRWADVAATVRRAAGRPVESLEYRDTYRDPQRLGPGKKSLLFTIALRSKEGTLTSQQADEVRDASWPPAGRSMERS